MKIDFYTHLAAQKFDSDTVQGVTGRVAIGQSDGAPNFCMRVFELDPGGFTPRHQHDWEHEIFFHQGQGEVWHDGQWRPVEAGAFAFIPGREMHQIRNRGDRKLVFVCLIPAGAPEL
jgi:quercetin dioxygenase-like cupin family protein